MTAHDPKVTLMLRYIAGVHGERWCARAADEIERLSAEVERLSSLPSVEYVVHRLTTEPLRDVDAAPATIHDAHVMHRYDWQCAICRAGDRPPALNALVGAVLRTVESHVAAVLDGSGT